MWGMGVGFPHLSGGWGWRQPKGGHATGRCQTRWGGWAKGKEPSMVREDVGLDPSCLRWDPGPTLRVWPRTENTQLVFEPLFISQFP